MGYQIGPLWWNGLGGGAIGTDLDERTMLIAECYGDDYTCYVVVDNNIVYPPSEVARKARGEDQDYEGVPEADRVVSDVDFQTGCKQFLALAQPAIDRWKTAHQQ